MAKESIILGLLIIIIGIFITIKTQTIFSGLIFILIGIALIIFQKEEDKVEKRRDKK